MSGGALAAQVLGIGGQDMRASRVIAAVLASVAVLAPLQAKAGWIIGGSGSQYAQAKSMPAGEISATSITGRNVVVSWTPSQLSGGIAVDDYKVRRYDAASGAEQTVGASCSSFVSGLTCTDTAVPPGDWKYTVQPRKGNWLGAESPLSNAATVAGPSMFFTGTTTVASLPTILNGDLTGFITGETVQFRLDNAVTGTLLSATLTPSSIPGSGAASFTVPIPAGTVNGLHTVYAVGNQGDVASAGITVSVPTPRSYTSSAFDLRDASGPSEADQSHPLAFVDTKTVALGPWPAAFSTSRYLDFVLTAPLQTGNSTSNMNFNFRFASTGANTSCFYFEVRRASTGDVLGTHGSATNPVACATGTTMVSTTTPIPEVTTTTLANDLRIRVFGRNTASAASSEDLVSVSGSSSDGNFTIYPTSVTDATSGTPAGPYWWSLQANDTTYFTNSNNWPTAFNSAKYLKFTFPGYTPAGAIVTGGTFTHTYRSNTTGTTCYYLEIYNGATLIGTKGSSLVPYCNATTAFVTDSISIPEINTVAKANNVTVKMYVRNSAGRLSLHDLARLQINYLN